MQQRADFVNDSEAFVKNSEAPQKRRPFQKKRRPFWKNQRPFLGIFILPYYDAYARLYGPAVARPELQNQQKLFQNQQKPMLQTFCVKLFAENCIPLQNQSCI